MTAWRPAGPVSRPLPADFVMADAIMPIPPPSAEDGGPSLSKYVARENFESLDRNIKDSNHWDDLKDDPMFRPIPDDGAVVPIAELISHRNLHDDAEEGSDSEREDGELTQESNVMSDDLDSWDVMNSLEHALNAGGPPANDYHPRGEPSTQPVEQAHLQLQYEEPSSEVDTARATEERLAALGVTGMPKPVRAPARPYPPPEPQTQASPVQDLGSRGRSPRRIDTCVVPLHYVSLVLTIVVAALPTTVVTGLILAPEADHVNGIQRHPSTVCSMISTSPLQFESIAMEILRMIRNGVT